VLTPSFDASLFSTADISALMARAKRRSDSSSSTPAPDGFGPRLVRLRQARRLTQVELGALVGLSDRMIMYHERDDAQPPGAMLVDLGRALKVSADGLLGLTPLRETPSPKVARLLKRIERLAELPDAEQRAVLKVVDGFLVACER
jgi:transcriptional regulator with XRE-family HTH domain